jgi:hypothetical protein
MCMMAILYRVARNSPILVAANREEAWSRPTLYPKIQSGTPRVVCGIDKQAGGTWLGVNQHGLFVTVTNRPKAGISQERRSRGLLCREMLACRSAREAADLAVSELSTGRYAGANYVCLDQKAGLVVYGGNRIEVVELQPGLHTLSNGKLNDPHDQRHEFIHRMLTLHKLDSSVTFLAVASRAFARKPDAEGRRGVVLTGGECGTVSSTLVSLTKRIQQSVLQYCDGPPSDKHYQDLSALVRQVLSAGRNRKAAAKAAAQKDLALLGAGAPADDDEFDADDLDLDLAGEFDDEIGDDDDLAGDDGADDR